MRSNKNLISDFFNFLLRLLVKDMSRHWCHWCMLSPIEWEAYGRKKGHSWTVTLIQDNLEK